MLNGNNIQANHSHNYPTEFRKQDLYFLCAKTVCSLLNYALRMENPTVSTSPFLRDKDLSLQRQILMTKIAVIHFW